MDEESIRVPVYLITGFLEAGKTTFLNGTINQPYFYENGTTVLIVCEKGVEPYNKKRLSDSFHIEIETAASVEELSTSYFEKLESKYKPVRILIEYNGMWRVSTLESIPLPQGWGIIQKITIVDACTFSVYSANMKPLFVEMVRGADMVVFNRCEDKKVLPGYRRSVKVVSPRTVIIFDNNGEQVTDIFANDVPYDMDGPVITVAEEDFGIWYVDAMDKPDRYNGRIVDFTACVIRPKEYPPNAFILGRRAMTCCAEDLTFIGYPCRYDGEESLPSKQWVNIRARISYTHDKKSGEDRPFLTAIAATKADPISDLVYFN